MPSPYSAKDTMPDTKHPFYVELDTAQAAVGQEQGVADYIFEAACPVCSAENLPMGILARLVHYRCSACGMGYSAMMTESAWESYGHSWDPELDAS